MRILVAVATIIVTFVTTGSAAATDYYVATNGNDANNGRTTSTPWRTFARSIPKLRAGDNLYARAGTYRERVSVTVPDGVAGSRIGLRAYPGERPVIAGQLWLLSADHWVVNGINVTWDGGTGTNLARVSGGTDWYWQNSEIWDSHAQAGLLIDDGYNNDRPLGTFTVRWNCIHDTVPNGGANQDHNIYVNDFNGSPNASGVIERNVLFNATNGRNVKLGPGDPPEGGPHHVVVRYNTGDNAAQSMSASVATHDLTFTRNLLTRGRDANFWSFELTGLNNVASDNGVDDSGDVFAGTSGTVVPITDGGGNVRLPMSFDSLSCAGYHPTDPVAQQYGRYAP